MLTIWLFSSEISSWSMQVETLSKCAFIHAWELSLHSFLGWILHKVMFLQCALISPHIAFQELSWDGLRWCLKAITQKELCRNHKIICKAHRKTVASDVPSALTHIYTAWGVLLLPWWTPYVSVWLSFCSLDPYSLALFAWLSSEDHVCVLTRWHLRKQTQRHSLGSHGKWGCKGKGAAQQCQGYPSGPLHFWKPRMNVLL